MLTFLVIAVPFRDSSGTCSTLKNPCGGNSNTVRGSEGRAVHGRPRQQIPSPVADPFKDFRQNGFQILIWPTACMHSHSALASARRQALEGVALPSRLQDLNLGLEGAGKLQISAGGAGS